MKTRICKRCGAKYRSKIKYNSYCKKCNEKIKKENLIRLNKLRKEDRKKKIMLRIEKGDEYFQKKISIEMIRSLYDLQYMMHESDWETLKLNKDDKNIDKFFDIMACMIDAIDEGGLCKIDEKTGRFAESKDKYYHSGRKPRWRKIKN